MLRMPLLRLIEILFFLSGASALIYEVVWMRQLTQIFGNTAHATATVLTAFMAGLSLGSFAFGRLADRAGATVTFYGVLEIGVGLYGLAFPWFLAFLPHLYRNLFPVMEQSFLEYSLILFAVTFLFLLVPTTLMGATLPVLSKVVVRHLGDLGERVGRLYGFNTFGAVAGCLLAGFVFMETLGLSATVRAAAILNLVVGGAVVLLGFARIFREAKAFPEGSTAPAGNPDGSPSRGLPMRGLVLLGIGLSGAAALIYENAWTRMLALILGSSTYAFTLMLAIFLAGLAWGGYYYGKRWANRPPTWSAFGWIEVAIALSVLAMIPLYERLPFAFITLLSVLGTRFPFLSLAQAWIAFAMMAVPTFLLGMTLPLAARLYVQNAERVGSHVGAVYASNTLGAILGAFAGGFVLIPALELQGTLMAGAGLNAATGVLFLALTPGRRPASRLAMGGAAAAGITALVLWMPAWDKQILTSGPMVYARSYIAFPNDWLLREDLKRCPILFYRDGLSATISVHRDPRNGALFLRSNGKTDASDGDALTQAMVGYLPMMFQPAAKRVAIVGMGSGVTAHAVAAFPVERIEVIEIEPAVIEAARLFSERNGRIHEDPRVRFVHADGRNYLTAVPWLYDVIVSEPSNPWIAGIANLYTREFYTQALRKLKPGGVFCQWVQSYAMSPADLQMILRTFAEAFPHVSLWQALEGDYLLLGSQTPLSRPRKAVQETLDRYPQVAADLARLGLPTVHAVLSLHRLDREGILRFARGAPLNTDDRPRLEFRAPRNLFLATAKLNQALLAEYELEAPEPNRCDVHHQRSLGALAGRSWSRALKHVDRAIACNGRNPRFWVTRGKILGELERYPEAREALQKALALKGVSIESVVRIAEPFPVRERYALGRALVQQHPGFLPGRILLAGALLDREEPQEAFELLRGVLKKPTIPPRAALLASHALAGLGKIREAERFLALARDLEKEARWSAVQALIAHGKGLHRKAAATFQEAFRKSSMDVAYLVHKGVCLMEAGAWKEARRMLQYVVALRPGHVAAWKHLLTLENRMREA